MQPASQQAGGAEFDLTKATSSLKAAEFAKPYIDEYLPTSPFGTLIAITALMAVGTLLKDIFIVINNVLVARMSQLATFDLRKLF